MNAVTSLIATATSDQQVLSAVDQVANKSASWWLAGIGLLAAVGIVWFVRWVVAQNTKLVAKLEESSDGKIALLRDVVTGNTAAMNKVAEALHSNNERLEDIEDAIKERAKA